MSDALYAISSDPITFGHINLIERGLKVFDHILVGIGINSTKKYTFSLQERENLTKKALQKFGEKVSVKSFNGLLVDFAYENQIKVIIRGARNSLDFDFERMITDINHGFKMDLDTFILVADPTLSHISSSTAKELQRNQAKNLIDYVPLIIKQALEIRISDQFLIGVTGGIGSGKSFITKKLISLSTVHPGLSIKYIDMDHIGRYILKESNEALHRSIREKIAHNFGKNLLKDNMIDVNTLLSLMFDDPEARSLKSEFEKIMAEPIMHMLRKKLLDMKGIILINSALFVEAGICDFVNNNFIVVDCDEDIKIERLKKRGYSDNQIQNRIKAQHTNSGRIEAIESLIKKHNCGQIIRVINNNDSNSEILSAFNQIKNLYEMYKKELF